MERNIFCKKYYLSEYSNFTNQEEPAPELLQSSPCWNKFYMITFWCYATEFY